MTDISELNSIQRGNANLIIRAALPYGHDAIKAALMTAGDESSWLRYANDGSTTRSDVPQVWRDLAATSLHFPYDAVAGSAWTTADSVGLFQQRAMYGYGTIAELMDPIRSTVIFLRGSTGGQTRAFLNAPPAMTLAQRCQWTQGSEFPTGDNYAPFAAVAEQLIAAFVAPIPPTPPEDTLSAQEVKQITDHIDVKFTALQKQVDAVRAKIDTNAHVLGATTTKLVDGRFGISDVLAAVAHKLDAIPAKPVKK